MTIRWDIAAWNYDVSTETIFNCWLKARVFSVKQESMTEQKAKKYDYMNEMRETALSVNTAKKATHRIDANATRLNFEMQTVINGMKNNNYIDTIMDVKQWIDFSSEQVDDTKKDVFEYAVKLYKKGPKREHETNEKNEIVSIIKHNNALYVANMLREYEKQQKHDDKKLIRRLNRKIIEIRQTTTHNFKQRNIVDYFATKNSN